MLDNIQNLAEIVKIIEFETDATIEEMAKSIGKTRSHLSVVLNQGASNDVLETYASKLKVAYSKEIEHFVSRYAQKETAPSQEPLLNEILERVKQIEISLNFLSGYNSSTPSQSHTEDISDNEHIQDPLNEEGRENMLRAERQARTIAKKKRDEDQGKD